MSVRVAAIQMSSGAEVGANLELAGSLIREAASDGCRLVALPENLALMPRQARDKAQHAEEPGRGPIQEFLANAARRERLWIVGGSLPLRSNDPERVYGGCAVFDDTGVLRASYRKIHLFDVDLAVSQESYRESNSMTAGDAPVIVETPAGRLGLSICYDLRFPELFRRYVADGASLFTVPAAFTAVTGRAHWRTLLAARAIENLAWVIAPGQWGTHPDGRATWGHSMIVDPWGTVVAELPDGNGFVAADIDDAQVMRLRREFPALANRRLT
jgi:nitrilase